MTRVSAIGSALLRPTWVRAGKVNSASNGFASSGTSAANGLPSWTLGNASGTPPDAAGSSATDSLWVKMKRLLTNTLYWALTYAFVVCGVTTTGFVESHIIAFAEHKGMTAQDGAFAFGLLSAFNGLGILAAGWLADRYHRVYMLAAIFFVRGLCYAAMLVVSS